MAIGQGAQTLNPNRFILDQRHNRVTYSVCMSDQVDLG